MRGYKGFGKDLKCRGMQYEVGKTYHQDGKIRTCENGLHFCKYLNQVFSFYDLYEGSRYCEVEAFGEIDFSRVVKFAASDIRIVRELSEIEINRCQYGSSYSYVHDDNLIFGNGFSHGYGYPYGAGRGHGEGYAYGDGYFYGYKRGEGWGYGNGYGEEEESGGV